MTRNTLIAIIGGVVAVAALAGFVYYLRARNIAELLPAPAIQQSATSQQAVEAKKAQAVPVGSTRETATGVESKRVGDLQIIKAQYTPDEVKTLSETAAADATLPEDLTATWSPEFRARIEAQQKSRTP